MTETKEHKLIRIYGIVQGVGFRPYVSRLAMHHGIYGTVCNKGSYVEIDAQADTVSMKAFLEALPREAPARSVILKVKTRELPLTEETQTGDGSDAHNGRFNIIDSEKEDGQIFVSPDIATCPDCERELFDHKNRRYLHPFINCTSCGPRLTILDSMPYDRERTSMGEFDMCPECEYEYTHASTRRYHAQPVCCNDCGPELYLLGREERGQEALIAARKIIREGGIVAIKGIGGYHLACDASNEDAVQLLRSRKHRPFKPFAVMMKDMETVRKVCQVCEGEEKIMTGPQKPILLLRQKKPAEAGGSGVQGYSGDAASTAASAAGQTDGAIIAPSVAPGNPNLGVMLPYAPVQMLLFHDPADPEDPDGTNFPDALVMTSGNPSGAPICMDDAEAEKYLSPLADAILSNPRKIRIRADDSVMAYYDDQPYMIRRSRGYAPLPVILKEESEHSVLGIGGELKNTFCLASGDLCYPSPYIGDMADMRSVRALQAAVERMERLLEIRPEIAVCDLHPKYNTTEMARVISEKEGIDLMMIQHHYAHIAACLAENEYNEKVIGVALDGTGFGEDGSIWGGEFLEADLHEYERIGSIQKFAHAGGDLASKEGWRIAYSILRSEIADEDKFQSLVETLGLGQEQDRKAVDFMLGNNVNTVVSTSTGRLFDAASAILGIKQVNTFEGEASMALQFAAERAREEGRTIDGYFGKLMNIDESEFRLCTNSLLKEIAEKRAQGEDPDALAYFFHEALAEMIVIGCCYARTNNAISTVALSGGVFQNLLLLELTEKGLKREGFTVLKHSQVPANDGGIALGQAAVALNKLSAQDAKSALNEENEQNEEDK